MTEENSRQKQIAASIVRKVAVKTGVLVAVAVAGSLAYSVMRGGDRWWFLPAGVLIGGGLGLVNFHWLAITVERVYVRRGASTTGANVAGGIINLLKLSAIFVVLFVVIKWELLNVLGLVAGLSLCFIAILWEGVRLMATGLKGGSE